MYGRDPLLPLNKLLQPKVRYLGNDENILSLEALKNIYQLVVTNLKLAHEKRQPNVHWNPKLKEGDLVLGKDHTAKAFQPRFKGNYRVVSQKGNQVEIRPTEDGETIKFHVTDIQGGHGTGKTGNLAVNFSRQGKHREFSKFNFLHRENCGNTGKILKI